MRVLVIGGGGREHALVWRLRQCPSVTEVHAIPGNPGIAHIAQCHASEDYVQLAEAIRADLTVVGPEAPLVSGIVDRFRASHMPIVGPTAVNAAMEGSKIHSKQLMKRIGVPTAHFETIGNAAQAAPALTRFRYPVVLKTDGLAAGKGVVIAHTPEEATSALTTLPFPLVIEEYLEGREVSFIVLCDGTNAVPLEPSQDHKRVSDHDLGPNTGGMGAYSDSRILTNEQRDHIMETIINPVVHATGFTGFLYAGLMMTPTGPKVLEFNVRMGDPETQVLMMRLESDWGEVLMDAARGALTYDKLHWSPQSATCVVLASAGYPGAFETGKEILGLNTVHPEEAVVFHAGTRAEGDRLVTAGGRVLGVTATGSDLKQSIDRAYAAVSHIHFDGMHYRKDIGNRGLKRYNEAVVGT
jgi:phosphoribosylamine--glycine ligase